MKTSILYSFVFLLMVLTGCESPLHDNFVEIEKPAETSFSINLNAYAEGENIIIYQENIPIHYSFETQGKKVIKAEFTLGNNHWETEDREGSFWFPAYKLPEGTYTLTCQLYVATQSGSIADQLGTEAYGGTMSWKVTVDYEKEPTIIPEMTSRINEDGYLELIWQKPSFKYRKFLNYTVQKRGEMIATIDNPDVTSIVDKSHVVDYGEWYDVKINFTDGTSWYIGRKDLPNQYITLEQVEDVSAVDYCTVRWSNNGYKCKWNVYVDDELKLKETTETSIKILPGPFGVRWGNRYIRVEALAYEEEYRSPSPHTQSIQAGTLGKFLGDNYIRFDYSTSEDVIYYSVWGEVNSMSVSGLTPIMQDNTYGSTGYTNAISASEKNGNVVVYHPFKLALYSGKQLPAPQTFQLKTESITFGVKLLNDNRIFYFEKSMPEDITACVINTHMKEEKRTTLEGSSLYENPVISADGKYAYLNSYKEIAIYRFSPEFNVIEKKVYPVEEALSISAQFMPNNSSLILVRKLHSYSEGSVTLYNTEDMTPVHSYNALFGYIDPKTGYLCLSYLNRVEVVNMESGAILFSLPADPFQNPSLTGGVLISSSGYALNINPYLNKK